MSSQNKHTYREALEALNTLQSNAQSIESWIQARRTNPNLDLRDEMENCVERLGIDLGHLPAIHVAGTKGKGSTCAFVESILRKGGERTGLYISPHLVSVRERICLNGVPLSQSAFARYFWECWDRLEASKSDAYPSMPSYFRFLTLMAFHVFQKEGVEAVVIETGVGGRTDATNVLRPVCCGITALGMDHVAVLGGTLSSIAFEKSGIFKTGAPAFTVPQLPEAMEMLSRRGKELLGPSVELQVVPPLPHSFLEQAMGPLGLAGEHQLQNASLAVVLARQWKNRSHGPLVLTPDTLSHPIDQSELEGLIECRWLGRSQKEEWEGHVLYLDGAHTSESTQVCGEWFQASVPTGAQKILVFNCHPSRDPLALLPPLLSCGFSRIFICSNETLTPHILSNKLLDHKTKEIGSWQDREAEMCRTLTSLPVETFSSIPAVMGQLRSLSSQGPLHVLVTGSLYLVGGWLELLHPEFRDSL